MSTTQTEPTIVPGGFTRRQAHLNGIRAGFLDDGERGRYDLETFDRAYAFATRFPDWELLVGDADWIVFAAALRRTIACCDEVECDPGRSALAAVAAVRDLGLEVAW